MHSVHNELKLTDPGSRMICTPRCRGSEPRAHAAPPVGVTLRRRCHRSHVIITCRCSSTRQALPQTTRRPFPSRHSRESRTASQRSNTTHRPNGHRPCLRTTKSRGGWAVSMPPPLTPGIRPGVFSCGMAGAAISDLNIQLRQTELRAYDRQILGDTQHHSISSIDDLQTIAE